MKKIFLLISLEQLGVLIKMKLDFYFIHGWGFDQSFWEPV